MVTPAERMWVATHPVYNCRLGFPYFNIAIEHLEPSKWYSLRVTMESIEYNEEILPIICVPAGEGKIIADFELEDLRGNVSTGVPIKRVALPSKPNRTTEVQYLSELGLLSIRYQCDYFDKRVNLHKRETSSTGNPDLAMVRQIVNNTWYDTAANRRLGIPLMPWFLPSNGLKAEKHRNRYNFLAVATVSLRKNLIWKGIYR